MKVKFLLLIATLSTFILTGCQSNNLSAENQALKQQITELEYQLTQLQEANHNTNTSPASDVNVNQNTISENAITRNSTENVTATYSLDELSAMVDEFVASVGSATPNMNITDNLDQFFSHKKQGDQIEHALENYENFLDSQYRIGNITHDEYRQTEREIDKLEDYVDSACDRLEIAFGIDD